MPNSLFRGERIRVENVVKVSGGHGKVLILNAPNDNYVFWLGPPSQINCFF